MNCIFCAIAAKNGIYNEKVQLLLKNAYTALFSAGWHNPEATRLLVTNIENLSKEYVKLYEEAGIQLVYVPFDKYVFVQEIPYQLAYYKICALEHVATMGFDRVVLIDADCLVVRSFAGLWEDCDEVMLYCCRYTFQHTGRQIFFHELQSFFQDDRKLLYWGGEFVAGTSEKLKVFLKECESVYARMMQGKVASYRGDEFIWSCAAAEVPVKEANAYICRQFTGRRYETTNSFWYDGCIIHLPVEKETGLQWVYKYILRCGQMPKQTTLFRKIGLPGKRRPLRTISCFTFSYLFKEILLKRFKR